MTDITLRFGAHIWNYLQANLDPGEEGRFWHSPLVRSIGIFTAIVLGCTLLYWYGMHYDREMPGKYFDPARDYQRMPFDMLDATRICEQKTQLKFGDTFVRSYVDQHSTRFDVARGIYKVFLFVHIGTTKVFEEAPVHCFVDPSQHMVSHYRSFEKRRSLMSRALSVLENKK